MFQIAARTEYGCLAMLELAVAYDSTEPTRVRDIAKAHDIPSGFLVQILLQLKAAGLVESVRGAGGGYRLVGAPDAITLADVVTVLEGKQKRGSHLKSGSAASVVLTAAWTELSTLHREWLEATTLAQLVERMSGASTEMYYI